MYKHINESKALREELNSIAEDFHNGINQHYLVAAMAKGSNGGNHMVKELTLNIKDKFECIKLGDSLNISQWGFDFSVKDKGWSLLIGMSMDNWQEKFSLSKKKGSCMRNKEGWVVVENIGRGGQDHEETTKSNP